MGTFRVTIDINRPAPDVFAFVAEPRNMPRWYQAVERVAEVTPRTSTKAASYQITRSLPGGRADNIVEVTESMPTLTVTFVSREGPTPFRYRYAIEPDRDRSRLTLDADISSDGLPGPLAHLDAVATRAFKQGMQHNLEGLKHLVESNAPSQSDPHDVQATATSS
jgi:uncharacterized protein YndB with AHSA1/START domain